MSEALQHLIEALREELKQYGEMLALLDQQQEQVMQRASDELLRSVAGIQSQGTVIQKARHHRERCQRELAGWAGLPENALLADLLPRLPAEYHPLITALVEENNELLVRVRQRSRQNHMLLVRSIKLMQQLLAVLSPGIGPVYTESGGMADQAVPAHSGYEAVG